jgi:hypothetical protein
MLSICGQKDGRDIAMDKKQRGQESRWRQLGSALFFGAFTAFGVYMIQSGAFDKHADWLQLLLSAGYYVMFPIMTLASLAAFIFNWSDENADNVIMLSMFWVFLGIPLLLVALGLLWWLASTVLGSAPAWAIVIIVLLGLILLRTK